MEVYALSSDGDPGSREAWTLVTNRTPTWIGQPHVAPCVDENKYDSRSQGPGSDRLQDYPIHPIVTWMAFLPEKSWVLRSLGLGFWVSWIPTVLS